MGWNKDTFIKQQKNVFQIVSKIICVHVRVFAKLKCKPEVSFEKVKVTKNNLHAHQNLYLKFSTTVKNKQTNKPKNASVHTVLVYTEKKMALFSYQWPLNLQIRQKGKDAL